MPASERIPALTAEVAATDPRAATLLRDGELTVEGRLRDASNATLYCSVQLEDQHAHCVYKPVAGERPLWDFPDGTLAAREVAARVLAEATGWGLVPPTVLRDGPFGTGMCQLWITDADTTGLDAPDGDTSAGTESSTDTASGPDAPDTSADDTVTQAPLLAVLEGDDPSGIAAEWCPVVPVELADRRTGWLVHADDARLRRLAVLDVVINNADRKGGHLLTDAADQLYAVDHGVSFAVDDKLRTLLWGWAGQPLLEEHLTVLRRLRDSLAGGQLDTHLAALLNAEEREATRARVQALLTSGTHPSPAADRVAIPWPPV